MRWLSRLGCVVFGHRWLYNLTGETPRGFVCARCCGLRQGERGPDGRRLLPPPRRGATHTREALIDEIERMLYPEPPGALAPAEVARLRAMPKAELDWVRGALSRVWDQSRDYCKRQTLATIVPLVRPLKLSELTDELHTPDEWDDGWLAALRTVKDRVEDDFRGCDIPPPRVALSKSEP